jgi:aerobic-type carbon monoxide dehydrogenase small subunit (CoxS/CutS family)
VKVESDGGSLLDALREQLGVRSVKDGCSPQGQCGCCTVLVDGVARVACVTPLRRVAGRSVTTADGLDPVVKARLVDAFSRHGASQCGFCTPGILCRLAPLGECPSAERVESALLAHLCRCTGWRSITAAATESGAPTAATPGDPAAAGRRATLEGGTAQRTGPDVVLGRGAFAADSAPPGCLIAVPDRTGGWAVGETLAEARANSGQVPGRRSGQLLRYPVDVPPGDWDFTLQTTWVEPAYLELDSSWCLPGGQPAHPAGNGGAFGGKVASPAPAVARDLADRYHRPVQVLFSREDAVRQGPKRPPAAAGMRVDGTGRLDLAAAPGVAAAARAMAPGIEVREVEGVVSPRLSGAIRAAGWAEAAVLVAAGRALAAGKVPAARRVPAEGGVGAATVVAPDGGWAEASVTVDTAGWPLGVEVTVRCGDPLDQTVLRSYVTGAAHMGLGWVCSEGIAVGEDGVPEDLTIRSFGILPARATPPIAVEVEPGFGAGGAAGEPVRGSDAAFAAVAAATWIAQGLPARWPTRRGADNTRSRA